eukprot:8758112-Karenia_brevis.AAC.1
MGPAVKADCLGCTRPLHCISGCDFRVGPGPGLSSQGRLFRVGPGYTERPQTGPAKVFGPLATLDLEAVAYLGQAAQAGRVAQ